MARSISYFLAAVGLLFGYLLTHHSAPLTTFHMEWFFAVGWIFLTAGFLLDAKIVDPSLLRQSGTVIALPLSLVIVAIIDYLVGRNEYPGSLVLYVTYMAMLAGAIYLGIQVAVQSDSAASRRFMILFAVVISLAAILNGFAGFVQILGIDLPSWLVVRIGTSSRMFGNMRQPNLYSTMLTLGVIALMGLSFAKRIGRYEIKPWVFILAAAFLGVASALSASRTGLLLAIVVSVTAWSGKGLPRLSRIIAAVSAGASICGWVVLSKLGAAGDVAYSGLQRMDMSAGADFSSRRDDLWLAMIQLILEHPLVGSGFNRLNYDYFMLDVPKRIALNLQNAHNVPLQIAVEHGLPFALAWIALICVVLWSVRKTWSMPIARLCWMVLIALGIHSSLEYPLWYFYFLLPAGLALGALVGFGAKSAVVEIDSVAPKQKFAQVRGRLVAVATAACLIAAVGIFKDYQKVLPVFQAASPEAVMGLLERAYTTRLFTPWVDYAVVANVPVTPENAKLHNRVSKRLSTFSIQNFVVMNLALSNAMLGRIEESVFYLGRLKEIYGGNLELVTQQLTPAEQEILKPALDMLNERKK